MLTSSMLVSAPLMCIGGIIMALRENLQMSWLLTISVPLLGITVSVVVAKLIPHFRTMQTRIDNINRSLREQLTGMRVIRAFVREPDETIRFDKANKELTDTSLLIGRYQAVLLPTVMLIANLSSVAVLWFGAHLVDTGDMQIGQISAFLAYVMQILMSVVMATMLAVVIPARPCVPTASPRYSTPSRPCPHRPSPFARPAPTALSSSVEPDSRIRELKRQSCRMSRCDACQERSPRSLAVPVVANRPSSHSSPDCSTSR